MERRVIVRHDLSYSEEGELVNQDGEVFDTEQYGRMKFGSHEAARTMGLELGKLIVAEEMDFVLGEEKIMSPFMYKHVPSAARTIAKYAFMALNSARADEGLDRIHTRQVFIKNQPNADYSKLDKTARMQYMTDSGLMLVTEPLDGYNVLLLDDIRITGTYASLVQQMAEKYDVSTLLEAYWAAVDPAEARTNPAIENKINSGAGTGLELVRDIIEEDGLVPTLRTLKLLLSHDDPEALEEFFCELPEEILIDLYEGAVGTGSDLLAMYKDNYRLLDRVASGVLLDRLVTRHKSGRLVQKV